MRRSARIRKENIALELAGLWQNVYAYVYTFPRKAQIRFEWNEAKNRSNIRKHGLDFADGKELFLGGNPLLVAPDVEAEYGEERWRGIGTIKERVVVVVFTERRPGVIRFISLRKSNQEERKAYEEAIKEELGPH